MTPTTIHSSKSGMTKLSTSLRTFIVIALFYVFVNIYSENAFMQAQVERSKETTIPLAANNAIPEDASVPTLPPTPSRIPHIVHQSYSTTSLPASFTTFRNSCIHLSPSWEFKLWTNTDNRELVATEYPHLLDLYDSYNVKIKRIDMVRYLYLHKYGGVYIDLDMACLNPFSDVFDAFEDKFLVASQFIKKVDYANTFIASPTDHPIFGNDLRKSSFHS